MLGVLANAAGIVLGSLVGMFVKKGINDRLADAVMKALGLCTLIIGLSGALSGNPLVMILSMVAGTIAGTALDIDGHMNRLSDRLSKRFKAEGNSSFSQGFLTATLFVCVGAMAIVGSLNAGLKGDNQVLFTKSILDFVTCIMLAGGMGIGVLFSAVPLFLYEGSLVMLARLLQSVLSNQALITEINGVGSLMIMAIALNIMGLTRIKVADLLPAVLFVPLMYALAGLLPL